MNGLLISAGMPLPEFLRTGPMDGGAFNLLAFVISLVITGLLVIGTSKSAKVNAVLVAIKIVALTAFIFVALPAVKDANFEPFLPAGWGSPLGGIGVLGAAASIFFAYVGFDAVSTAAEETKNPNRNIPIGLIASLAVCTVFYMLVSYGAVGAVGSQPVLGPDGVPLHPGSPELAAACAGSEALVCSKEPLAHVLRLLGFASLGNAIGLAAALALPSVILMMIYGQTRIFFVMSRDGLLPEKLSEWNHDHSLDWHLLDNRNHAGVQALIGDLKQLYRTTPALHEQDCEASGFEWLLTDDSGRNVFAWLRKGFAERAARVVVVNFSPNVYYNYRVRVPLSGKWREALNSDSAHYGGSNVGNAGAVEALQGNGHQLNLTIPPLAAIFLVPES